MSTVLLHLRPGVGEVFLSWLADTHPHLVADYRRRYCYRAYAPAADQRAPPPRWPPWWPATAARPPSGTTLSTSPGRRRRHRPPSPPGHRSTHRTDTDTDTDTQLSLL